MEIAENVEINRVYYRSNMITPIVLLDEEYRYIPFTDCIGYMASNHGNVYNPMSRILITQHIGTSGYKVCKIHGKNQGVHRLVLQAFNPILDPENYDVNHKDTNKQNNWLYNLEWMTRSENIIHAFANNLAKQGEQHPNSKFTEAQVHIICKALEDGISYKDICDIIGLEYNHNMCTFLHKIKSGRSWKPISSLYNIQQSNFNNVQRLSKAIDY